MIEFQCDRCDETLAVEDDLAGTKMECPHCGDVNRVPAAAKPEPPEDAPRDVESDGLPPDSGPEQTVMVIRPSIWRSHPLTSVGLVLLPIVAAIVTGVAFETSANTIMLVGGVVAALCWLPLFGWWFTATMGVKLKITNKRTIEHRGLLSRATSEVMHDHVRNIQIDQSFINRVLSVGNVGISSSGQDGIEIQVRSIPRPDRMKSVIDKYRPM